MPKFKYLGTKGTNNDHIHIKAKSKVNSGSVCCHSVQNLCPSIS